MDRLRGKVSLITGASSGIGRRTAEVFAEEGSDLVLVARRRDRLKEVEEACKGLGVNAISVCADVSLSKDCATAVKTAIDTFGRIDVLVNDAAMGDRHFPITRCEPDWWDQVVRTDQYSVYYMMKEALKYMEPVNRGSIINVSSIGGTTYTSGIAYSSAKAAVIAMSVNVALQFAGTEIRVNVVAPGPTPTEFNTPEAIATFDMEFGERCGRHINLSLPESTPDDQARAILFFASDDSKACNGQVLTVDHGVTI